MRDYNSIRERKTTVSNKLTTWVEKFVEQTTKEWDWPVTFSIDKPEEYQTSFQIFLTLKKQQ